MAHLQSINENNSLIQQKGDNKSICDNVRPSVEQNARRKSVHLGRRTHFFDLVGGFIIKSPVETNRYRVSDICLEKLLFP
jgi:hypothetical protein